MKEIPVAGGLVALVDDEDFDPVCRYHWRPVRSPRSRTVYAQAYLRGSKPQRGILLHRLILGAPAGVLVDHKNLNGLDCQRHNLRLATDTQNNHNAPKRQTRNGSPTSSRYKGVHWHRRDGAWEARGMAGDKRVHLGNFKNEVEAALAYNAFAQEHYGEFARLNVTGEAAQS